MRTAGPADLPDLVELVHEAFAEYAGRLEPPSGAHRETDSSLGERLAGGALLAVDGTAALGCVFHAEQGADLYLSRLAVLPSARGRGIGRRLVESAFDVGRSRGLAAATVGVRLQLPENIGFFAALGFEPYELGSHEGARHPTFLRLRRPL